MNKDSKPLPPLRILILVPIISALYLLLILSLSYFDVERVGFLSAIYELLTIPFVLLFGSSIMMGLIKFKDLIQVMGPWYWIVFSIMTFTAILLVYFSIYF